MVQNYWKIKMGIKRLLEREKPSSVLLISVASSPSFDVACLILGFPYFFYIFFFLTDFKGHNVLAIMKDK